jgi:archaellum component FlaF (FlaF/FlaG flagellin family)
MASSVSNDCDSFMNSTRQTRSTIADKSDVVVDGTVVVGRSQQCAILPLDSARVALHAVVNLRAIGEVPDLIAQLVIHDQLRLY